MFELLTVRGKICVKWDYYNRLKTVCIIIVVCSVTPMINNSIFSKMWDEIASPFPSIAPLKFGNG